MSDAASCAPAGPSLAKELNRACFCLTLDRAKLAEALRGDSEDGAFFDTLIAERPHLFSAAPVFLPQRALDQMLATVRSIEAAAAAPAYREKALSWAPDIARRDFGPRGVFMGYDFHLCEDGPRLIEVNTNAGGAFLNAFLAKAQLICCSEVEVGLANAQAVHFEAAVLTMFQAEFARQGRPGNLSRVAIVDDRPQEQYLYPEFLLAQRLFRKNGIDAVIADAAELGYQEDRLVCGGQPIDLVYNRLTDFAFEQSEHAALKAAYVDGAVVVTPNPAVHALFADKRNLTLLSDSAWMRGCGLPPDAAYGLENIPRTELVEAGNAERLWAARGKLFFKPAAGHGSKAVYRGDKLTKRVWGEIIQGGYVAQDMAPPSERIIEVDGERVARKLDVRLYVYAGSILLTAARLYQGQTTNFRTPGGGFAPVLAI